MDIEDRTGALRPSQNGRTRLGWHPGYNLTVLEQEVVAGAATGELVDRGEGPFSLTEMRAWGAERTVRAAGTTGVLGGRARLPRLLASQPLALPEQGVLGDFWRLAPRGV